MIAEAIIILMATTAYPPCTAHRTDSCIDQGSQWPTLYIPCPKGQHCPAHDITKPKKRSG